MGVCSVPKGDGERLGVTGTVDLRTGVSVTM
jgi:hypothetical protein